MGISERKQREREQRRKLLIDTAEKVFFERGYEVTTMEQIAREAEFSKRTLYLYFRDKEELILAIAARGLEILEDLLNQSNKGDHGWDWISQILRTYTHFAMSYPDYYRATMVFESNSFFYGQAPEAMGPYGQKCWQINKRCTELCHTAIAQGLDDGSIHASLTPEQLTLLVWSQLTGVLQIVQSRSSILKEVYGLTSEMLFSNFMHQLTQSLCRQKET